GQSVYLLAVGRRMRAQLRELDRPRDDNPLGRLLGLLEASLSAGERDLESLELKLDEGVIRETPKLERGQSVVKLLAGVAPLMGLLGTVTGMIATFQAITLFGTGDPKLMADGISQALVTTVLGLVVAIPLLFLHSLLSARSRSLIRVLDEQAAGLIARRMESAPRD
ncbi:MotA/TolQ/ExbB proton channel family protein, partial [uncultured Abyssibacter sp.]|uniref:MotA/TolQ/ExbB proton channel family protein n=1 Tax=uncultured Abyssibacter sp. TaxID=2320202 RepID=UPI0032B22B79